MTFQADFTMISTTYRALLTRHDNSWQQQPAPFNLAILQLAPCFCASVFFRTKLAPVCFIVHPSKNLTVITKNE
jgi:hypothetical protein